tara:strand:- start:236 stop:418 length:183 start_codon:yes stop_codon:yes gene_type:complete
MMGKFQGRNRIFGIVRGIKNGFHGVAVQVIMLSYIEGFKFKMTNVTPSACYMILVILNTL